VIIEGAFPYLAAIWLAAVGPATEDAARTHALRYASVTVEIAIEGDSGAVLTRRIEERSDVVLRSAAVLPARNDEDTTISISVVYDDTDDPGYAFELRVVRDGETVGTPVEGGCSLCTEGELVADIETELEQVVSRIAPADPPNPRGAAAPTADAPATGRRTTAVDRQRRLGPKGIAGAALIGAGGAALVTGIGLAAAPPRSDPGDPRFELTTRPAGYALLGAGAAIAIVGGVLVGLDVGQRRRSTVSFDIHRTGVSLTASF
jgi:hypothetical protein